MKLAIRHTAAVVAFVAALVSVLDLAHGQDADSKSSTLRASAGPSVGSAVAQLAVPFACGLTPTTGSFAGTPGGIGGPQIGTLTATAVVAGLDAYLWDVDLNTVILHTDSSELDVTLTSPLGTVVTITTDNGGTADNAFNGSRWDDNVNLPVTDVIFASNAPAPALSPEGRLQSFRGENPNGLWTLTIQDDEVGETGTLVSWSLDIRTLAAAPVPTTLSFSRSLFLPIPNPGSTSDTLVVSGLGNYLFETELFLDIPHQYCEDLDIELSSPLGPAVRVSTDNGYSLFDVFAGSLFDVDALVPVTDALYTSLVAETPISPEGAFDNWLGQDPNGVWTLTVLDDFILSAGTLRAWTVSATTIPVPTPSAPGNFAGTTGAIPDMTFIPSGTFVFTAGVSGMPAYLWDVDLNTTIAHTFTDELRITLTSPQGTVVVITTRNAGSAAHVYNGTRWDDNVNAPATDFAYASGVTATPLSPEGRLGAFRGENPNGTWTLTIVDVGGGGYGTLSAWSLDLAAMASAPASSTSSHSRVPGLTIMDFSTVSDGMTVVDPGSSILEVELSLELPHVQARDLDITLTSPAGTVVTVTTDNGGANANVYNGSVFDPSLAGELAPVSDAVYANGVAETPLSPEGSFDNFLGQDPNGSWTLTVTDDTSGGLANAGTLVRWGLTIRTCTHVAPVAYCFGDGSGTACPCSPVPVAHGDADKGCPNNIFTGGAKLASSGTASLGADTLVLTVTNVLNGGGCLVYQGTTNNGGGLGAHFGDGLRCAAGSVARMRTHIVAGNAYQYPDPSFGDNAVSIRGAVTMPGIRYYQGWYRSANPSFCTVATFNLTNGSRVTWGP